jgi:hypothetical protein
MSGIAFATEILRLLGQCGPIFEYLVDQILSARCMAIGFEELLLVLLL